MYREDGHWSCLSKGAIDFGVGGSISHLWPKEWRVAKWGKRKNMLKWAKGSGAQDMINQRQLWSTSFWQVCMQPACTACRAVKIQLKPGLILMRVPDAPQSALIIRMFLQSPLTALHASCMHCMQTCQDCECFLKSKSLSDMWHPDPYPMQGFLWKGGSTWW